MLCGSLRRGLGRQQVDRRPEYLIDLTTFIDDHHAQGSMTGDATPPACNGYLLTVACGCGVTFERWITPWDAELGLLRAAGLN